MYLAKSMDSHLVFAYNPSRADVDGRYRSCLRGRVSVAVPSQPKVKDDVRGLQ